jgi:hypothetical protein
MSDIDTRLADVERRIQRLEILTGSTDTRPQNAPAPQLNGTLRNLLFWVGLIVLGVIIWNFSSKLSN